MSVLDKLNKVLLIKEQLEPICSAKQFIEVLKPKLRKCLSECFLKCVFDKTENNTGILFIKFANQSWEKATNECLENSNLNFIISIEGFDAEGNFNEDNLIEIEMFKYNDVNKCCRKMKRKKCYDLNNAKNYIENYFVKVENCVKEDVGAGTASGATGYATGGSERTEGNIAVHPAKMGVFRRSGRIDKKEKDNK